ncbi:MAG: sigma-70 family RNA polymerase sigma factor [Sediminibacterium sp.]
MEFNQLIKECRKGSITAQKYFYDQYAVKMFLYSRRYLKTNEQTEDILQNGFLKIFKGLVDFSFLNESATIGWMKKIMLNECLQEIRKRNNILSIAEEFDEEIYLEDDIVSKLSANEIYVLVTKIPIGYRTVFNLYVVEGYNHKEIADLLSISEGTSKSQLSKAKAFLQKMITKQNEYHEKRNSR